MPKVRLYYGYAIEPYGVSHAFQLVDPNQTDIDETNIINNLAETLRFSPDEDDFDWNVSDIELPESLVNAIKGDKEP